MLRRLLDVASLIGRPAAGELLERRDIKIAVVKIRLQIREPARHEAPILSDRVAAHWALALRNKSAEDFKKDLLALSFVDRTRPHTSHEARTRVRVGVPRIHGVEHIVALMQGNHRALVQNVEVLVGDDRRDLDHAVHFGLQPGHLHVDPDQVFIRIRGISFNIVRHG